jgi:hypothetical protein
MSLFDLYPQCPLDAGARGLHPDHSDGTTAAVALACRLHGTDHRVAAVGHPYHQLLGTELPGLLFIRACAEAAAGAGGDRGTLARRARRAYRAALAAAAPDDRPIARYRAAVAVGGRAPIAALGAIADASRGDLLRQIGGNDATLLEALCREVGLERGALHGCDASAGLAAWIAHGLATALLSIAILVSADTSPTCDDFQIRWARLHSELQRVRRPFGAHPDPLARVRSAAAAIHASATNPGWTGIAALTLSARR